MDKGDANTTVPTGNGLFGADFTSLHNAMKSQNQYYMNENRQAPNYSWHGVMDFLKEQEYKAQEREQKLINDKRALEDRVRLLEDEL